MSIYRRSLLYFRPYLWPTLGGMLLSLAATGLSILEPWPFKYIVDGILTTDGSAGAVQARDQLEQWFGEGDLMSALLFLCIAIVVIKLIWGVLNLVMNRIFIEVGLKALLRFRTDLYACLQALPLKYHDAKRSADSSFRVAYDSQSIQTIYNKGFASVFNSLVLLIWAVAVMLMLDWVLTLASLAVLPFVVVAVRYFAVLVRRQSTAIQERESDLLVQAQEGMSAVRVVHAFGRQDYEIAQFRDRASQSLQANLRLNVTSVTSTLVIGTLMAIGTAVLYYVGSRQVLTTEFTLGDLVVFATYLAMLYKPLEQLSYTAWALEGAAAAASRCFEILDREEEGRDAPGARVLQRCDGGITFDHVSFGYKEDQPILEDITLDVEPGETMAFVGGTGTGKSTLLSLVPRFYDPTGGAVRVDGQDVRELTRASLRSQISLVLQDTLLFSTTIRENIAYGKPGASDAEIMQAAERAQALEFISRLPQGIDSLVGERGGHLSVGQRQRIGIARAFLKNSPVLLLDEPTSALDPTTERAIMETIKELMKGRTTLIITHRLATVHGIGRIAVLEHGKLAEVGTGPDLLGRSGVYAKLYRSGFADPATSSGEGA